MSDHESDWMRPFTEETQRWYDRTMIGEAEEFRRSVDRLKAATMAGILPILQPVADWLLRMADRISK